MVWSTVLCCCNHSVHARLIATPIKHIRVFVVFGSSVVVINYCRVNASQHMVDRTETDDTTGSLESYVPISSHT